MAINPIYFQNTGTTIVPDVMYKAPYEQIKENNKLSAELRFQNQANVNTLKALTNMKVLPSDEAKLQASNEEYYNQIDNISKKLMDNGKTSEANIEMKDLATKLYKDIQFGDRSIWSERTNAVAINNGLNIQSKLIEKDPTMFSQFTEITKNLIQNSNNKDDIRLISTYVATPKPTFDVDKLGQGWAVMQKMLSRIDMGVGEDAKIDLSKLPQYLVAIEHTGDDGILKDIVSRYMKTFQDYHPYLKTLNYMGRNKDGKIGIMSDDENFDYLNGDVWNTEHPLHDEAMLIYDLIKNEAKKMMPNQTFESAANRAHNERVAKLRGKKEDEGADTQTEPSVQTE
jgi:hypothetical protein